MVLCDQACISFGVVWVNRFQQHVKTLLHGCLFYTQDDLWEKGIGKNLFCGLTKYKTNRIRFSTDKSFASNIGRVVEFFSSIQHSFSSSCANTDTRYIVQNKRNGCT